MAEMIDICPADEYDKALVFALKKWIADEINNIYDNGVCALCLTMEHDKKWTAGIGYNTEKKANETGTPWDVASWKEPCFSDADNDDAVYGMLEMWLGFKSFEDEDEVKDCYFRCAASAVKELTENYIFTERFNRNIPVLLVCGGMNGKTAGYTAAANAAGIVPNGFFEACEVSI